MGRPAKNIVLNNEHFIAAARAYRQHLETLGYHWQTVVTKHRQLLRFLHWIETSQVQEINQVEVHHLEQYRAWLQQQPNRVSGRPLSGKTIYGELQAVALFFIMLQSKGAITSNPFSTFKNACQASKTERAILSQEEISILYEATVNEQERAMLSLAYGCGLRAGELEAVNVADIKLREGILVVPKGKGNKRRTIPLSRAVKEDLKNYYGHRTPLQWETERVGRPSAFMLNQKGTRMRHYTWNKYLKRIIERTENVAIRSKGISLHSLRHSIATHLLEQGVPVEHVRTFLGHVELETTEIYTRVNQQQLQKLIK